MGPNPQAGGGTVRSSRPHRRCPAIPGEATSNSDRAGTSGPSTLQPCAWVLEVRQRLPLHRHDPTPDWVTRVKPMLLRVGRRLVETTVGPLVDDRNAGDGSAAERLRPNVPCSHRRFPTTGSACVRRRREVRPETRDGRLSGAYAVPLRTTSVVGLGPTRSASYRRLGCRLRLISGSRGARAARRQGRLAVGLESRSPGRLQSNHECHPVTSQVLPTA